MAHILEGFLMSSHPSPGAKQFGQGGTAPPPCWGWDPSPGQFSPLGQEGQAALLDMTSERCSKGPGPIYHEGAIIRFVNIQSSVVLLTRTLITLLSSSCTYCSGWLFYLQSYSQAQREEISFGHKLRGGFFFLLTLSPSLSSMWKYLANSDNDEKQ